MEHLTFDGDGANPSFVQKRVIDYGAFAEVHEVTSAPHGIAMESLIVSMKILARMRCVVQLWRLTIGVCTESIPRYVWTSRRSQRDQSEL